MRRIIAKHCRSWVWVLTFALSGCGEDVESEEKEEEGEEVGGETDGGSGASGGSGDDPDYSQDTETCGEPQIQSAQIPEYIDQIAQGKHNNEDWTFVGGEVYKSTFFGEEVYKVTLFPDTTEPSCNSTFEEGGDDRRILLQTGVTVGEYPFSETSYSPTFTYKIGGSFGNVSNPGNIEVTEITETQFSGRIAIHRNDCFHVNGTFSLPVCPDD